MDGEEVSTLEPHKHMGQLTVDKGTRTSPREHSPLSDRWCCWLREGLRVNLRQYTELTF